MTYLFYFCLMWAIGGTPAVVKAVINPLSSITGWHGFSWSLSIVCAIALRHYA